MSVTVHEVCTTIVNVLHHCYIRIQTGEDALKVIDVHHTCGFPQCFGTIDGSHIPILTPKEDPLDYYNRKGHHSIVLQALVDHECKFMNIFVGWPGSCHDARILANSTVFAKGKAGDLVPDRKQRIAGVDVPIVILGDPAYPLLPWLMKPYTATGALTREQRRFNYQLSRTLVVVECAFDRLKGHWRSLMKRNGTDVSFMPTLVSACCILHNLCEVHGNDFDDDWSCEDETPADVANATITVYFRNLFYFLL